MGTHIQACMLHGTESGICSYRYMPGTYGGGLEGKEIANKEWKLGTEGACKNGDADHCMPFCGKWIANYYPPCVPDPTILPDNKEYPLGNIAKHTVRQKDLWVEKTVKSIINNRIAIETNTTSKKMNVDEFGTKGRRTAIHFYKNKDCQLAYERYFCWLNFPRCDEFQESLPTCVSACENFFRVCNYDPELYRCNVGEVGEISMNHGNTSNMIANAKDLHSFFPGQPFKMNEFMPKNKNEPRATCTPSIKGAAYGGMHISWRGVAIPVITCLILFIILLC